MAARAPLRALPTEETPTLRPIASARRTLLGDAPSQRAAPRPPPIRARANEAKRARRHSGYLSVGFRISSRL